MSDKDKLEAVRQILLCNYETDDVGTDYFRGPVDAAMSILELKEDTDNA